MIVKTVGRGQDNSIVINDDKVSRTHLQMVQDDNGNISVVDVGSTNGTFVNGKRIVGETRLKSGDTVRIGDTSLPWQSYFGPAISESKVQTRKAPKPVVGETPRQAPHRKRPPIWFFIVGGAIVLLLIGGGIMLYLHSKQNAEKERVESERKKEQYNKLEIEASEAERDAAIAAAEYAAAQKKATETKSAKDIAEANEKKAAAEKAKKLADEKRNDMEKKMKEAERKAREAKNQATRDTAEANSARREAIRDRDNARRDAERESQKAKDSERQMTLPNEFYKQLNKAEEDNKMKAVCEALKIKTAKNDRERKNKLISKFNSANDNTSRESIINTMK